MHHNDDDAEMMQEHFGKGMLKVIDGQLTIIFECTTCGRFQLGPFPMLHAASMAKQMQDWAESIGLPVGKLERVASVEGDDPDLERKVQQRFDKMALQLDEDGNPWMLMLLVSGMGID